MTSTRRPTSSRCGIVPPYLLARLAVLDQPEATDRWEVPPDLAGREASQVADAARRTIATDAGLRRHREVYAERGRGNHRSLLPGSLAPERTLPKPPTAPSAEGEENAAANRSVHDAENGTSLPGTLVRAEGAAPTEDVAVNEAYDGLGGTWDLYWTAYQRDSLDGRGLPLVASVHYDRDYDNAFWDGEQMVFGDGDGVYFNRFTIAVDVIGHELTHGVTQFTAGLTYVGQSGALNESVSDCFGSMVKQKSLGHDAADADWLIGEGLFTSKVDGVALRSMKAPGTAYDDPVLGKDPQPADMDGFVELPHDDQHDNGGVHVNSGIPNRAFYLAATAIGGTSWEGAGLVWYDVLTSAGVPKDLDFPGFAQRTTEAAAKRFGTGSSQHDAVAQAWATVKVADPTAWLR